MPPPVRNGSPKWRAIWPVQSRPMPDSGVPNVGAPDCIDSDEAWGAIDGAILVLIFSMLIIGIGLQQSGALDLIVSDLVPLLSGLSPLMTLMLIYLLTSTLTEMITNNAVAIVMTPDPSWEKIGQLTRD